MTPISATVQKPAPRADRDIASPQPEADHPNPPGAERRRDFGAVLREASNPSAASRAGATQGGPAAADAPTGQAGSVEAGATPAPTPVDPAAALLAHLLNTALPAVAAGAPASPLATVAAADGTPIAGGPDAPVRDGASATAATAGSAPFRSTGALAANARPGPQPAVAEEGATLRGAPKIAVLDRAVHFKPIVTDGAAPEPARPDPAAPATAQTVTPQPLRAAVPELVAAAAKTAAKIRIVPQPEPVPADAASASAQGPDTTSLTAHEDSRAITGIARTVLDPEGRTDPERISGPVAQEGAGASLPAGTVTTIAAAIRDTVDRVAEAAPAARVQADPPVRAAPDGPLRTLRIQLRPEDLGTVTVELRLTNGQLETHLRASRPETAALLHRDSAILTDLLKQAHFQAEVTVGQARPGDGGAPSGGSSAHGQPFSHGGARPGPGGERQRQAEQHRQAAVRGDGERTDETVRSRDGGVYL